MTEFLFPVRWSMTGKHAATVFVPPVISRNFATDAAPVKIFHERKNTADVTKERIIIKNYQVDGTLQKAVPA